MIGVRVRHDHPPNEGAGGSADVAQVSGIVRPRIEHRDLAIAQEVSIRARARHQSRIAREDSANAGRQSDRRPSLFVHEIRRFIKFRSCSRGSILRESHFPQIRANPGFVSELGRILT